MDWLHWLVPYYVFQAPAPLSLASEGCLLLAEGGLAAGPGENRSTGSGVVREAGGGGVSGTRGLGADVPDSMSEPGRSSLAKTS